FDRIEHAQPRIPRRLKYYVGAAFNLGFGKLFSFAGIVPGRIRDSNVILKNLDPGVDVTGAFFVPGLEFVDERDVHPANESNLVDLRCPRRYQPDQERALVFLEDQRSDVGQVHNTVDYRELQIRIVPGNIRDDGRLGEADPDDQIVGPLGECPHAGLDRSRIAGFHISEYDWQVFFSPGHSLESRRVKGFVILPPNVIHNADVLLACFVPVAEYLAASRQQDRHA